MDALCGPLFQLRWYGTICPCLEQPQDGEAREALSVLGNKRVKWHRGASSGGSGRLGGFVSGLFSSSSSSTGDNVVDATLRFVDTDRGPQLHVDPSSSLLSMNLSPGSNDGEAAAPPMNQSAGYMKTIPLRKIDKAVASSGKVIKLKSEKGEASDETLVKIELMELDSDSVDLVIESFTRLIEWDGRRRAANPEEDLEEEEFESGIKARAQKAAHFAKREIELKQQKREREKRKEKYMNMKNGGLKYTAIAMANRETQIT